MAPAPAVWSQFFVAPNMTFIDFATLRQVSVAATQGIPVRFLGPKDNGMLQGYMQAWGH